MAGAAKRQAAKPVPEHRYGRGKFDAHPAYVEYMRMIVEHSHYAGMPGAVSDGGRINWQVSSGKTTSFYAHYVARAKWWVAKADSLKLPGRGKENDRFSVAARLIHPTGYRPCRLCGEPRNVGYFYLNAVLAARLNKQTGTTGFTKNQPIAEAIEMLKKLSERGRLKIEGTAEDVIKALFSERAEFFRKNGVSQEAFERSNHVRTRWLSPGFMANPPDRLDGFHDYCLMCRAKNDPGRSEANLRSYQRDRRAFQWWAEGDWKMADDLFNSAGPGTCSVCGAAIDRVSPDHVGPLACGFKQLPVFMPTCKPCNSSKNRRMRLGDVRLLLRYERRGGDSAASWHVRGVWDECKARIRTDADASELSAHMRAVQDCYLRCLYALLEAGHARFLCSLLSPQYAYFDHEFDELDTSTLRFRAVRKKKNMTAYRDSLARRSVRIAFGELIEYAQKDAARRKMRMGYAAACASLIERVLTYAKTLPRSPLDRSWDRLLRSGLDADALELAIGKLLGQTDDVGRETARKLRTFMQKEFDALARVASSAFA